MKRMVALSLLLVLLLVTACGGGSGAGSPGGGGSSTPTPSTSSPSGGGGSPAGGGSGGTPAPTVDQIRVWGGTPTGAWGPLMISISELMKKTFPNANVAVEPAGGSSAILAIDQGQGELSIAVSFIAAKAYNGEPPYETKASNLRSLMSLFDSPLQIVALQDSNINKIEDLKGKGVNFGNKGLNSQVLGFEVLYAMGIDPEKDMRPQYLGLGSGTDSMKNGQTDASFRGTGAPASDIVELATARKINLLSIPDDIIQKLIQNNPGLIEYTIPAGTYQGVDYDVKTISAPSAFLVPADLPDDVVYTMVKVIHENIAELTKVYAQMEEVTPERMAVDLGIPFHPGAEKYYREIGALK